MFRLQIVLEISSVEKLHLAHTKFTSSSFTITGVVVVVVAQICLGLKKFRPKKFLLIFSLIWNIIRRNKFVTTLFVVFLWITLSACGVFWFTTGPSKTELNNLLWNAEVRQSIWGNTPPRNEKQHNSGSLQRPNAHEVSIRCTATFKSKDYSYESAMMIGLQNYIPYSLSSARSDFSSDVVLTWRRETIIYESLNLLTSWYNWVSSLKILAMFITSIYFEATIFVKLAGQRLQY